MDTPAGALVGYFACVDLGACTDVHDLYRSFGKVGARWLTTVSTAIDPGCMLQYRERTLTRVEGAGGATIAIDDWLHQDVDPTLTGEACAIEEARARGTSMPCVTHAVQHAELRAP